MKGRQGGLAVYQKHGKAHMSRIGQKGAQVFWARYKLVPVDIAAWAIVCRKTGEVKALTNYHGGDK